MVAPIRPAPCGRNMKWFILFTIKLQQVWIHLMLWVESSGLNGWIKYNLFRSFYYDYTLKRLLQERAIVTVTSWNDYYMDFYSSVVVHIKRQNEENMWSPWLWPWYGFGARHTGLNISKTADHLGFSHTAVSQVYTDWCENKYSRKWVFF